jgi:hypothetical protein
MVSGGLGPVRAGSRRASYAEAVGVLGIPVWTVRSRLNQGRRYLSDALAATAADAHPDNAAMVRRRWQERSAAAEAMLRDGDAGGYFEDCAPDVLVSAPAMGYERQGIEGEARTIEAGLAAGVRMRLTRVVACQGVAIVEADYDNPPDDPEHCPPWHTEIRIHPSRTTTRLVLHFGQQFTASAAPCSG